MPWMCSVAGCKSNYKSEINERNISTFALPKDDRLKQKWVHNIPTDLTKLKNPRICIKHFDEQYVIRVQNVLVNNEMKEYARKYPKLQPEAVPTIFKGLPSYSTKKTVSFRRLCDVEETQIEQAIKESLINKVELDRGKLTLPSELPNDMENYMRYHVMGSVSQVRMKSGCIPTKFTCQPDRKTRTSDTIERPYICKKRKMMAFEECMVTEYTDLEEIGSRSPVSPNKEENMHFGDLEYLTKSESEQCDTSSNLIQDNVEIKEEPLLEIKEEPLVDIKEEPLVEIKEEPLVDIKEELLVEIKNEPLVKIKEEPLVEIKEEPLVEIKIEQND